MNTPFWGDTGWYAMERDLIGITEQITSFGFPMRADRACALLAELSDAEAEMAEALQRMLPPVDAPEIIVPKRNNKVKHYVKGEPFTKHKLVPFNPASSQQFVDRMTERHGSWPSTVMTDSGNPSCTAAVLATLPFPEAKALLHLKIATKRIGMLSGDSGYLTKMGADQRLHTVYHTLGAVTGRASHQPNVAQVPSVQRGPDGSPLLGAEGLWGYEFRDLFVPPDGWVLVGADLIGLEARVLAHYIAEYDGGTYAKLVTGGTDLHSINQANTGAGSRAAAKRLLYATIYGCGNRKAGTIVAPDEDDDVALSMIGKMAKDSLIAGISGFRELFDWLAGRNDDTLPGLDGRTLHARKKHARLNTLIQAAGAVLAKRWLILTDQALQAAGLRWARDYATVGWIHDEALHACRPELAEQVADIAKRCAVAAGDYYRLQCPMAAEAKIGASWAAVH